jgi:hypothetical protein
MVVQEMLSKAEVELVMLEPQTPAAVAAAATNANLVAAAAEVL